MTREQIIKRLGELRAEEQSALHALGVIRGRIAEKEKDLRDLIQQAPRLDEAERAAQIEGRGVGEDADS